VTATALVQKTMTVISSPDNVPAIPIHTAVSVINANLVSGISLTVKCANAMVTPNSVTHALASVCPVRTTPLATIVTAVSMDTTVTRYWVVKLVVDHAVVRTLLLPAIRMHLSVRLFPAPMMWHVIARKDTLVHGVTFALKTFTATQTNRVAFVRSVIAAIMSIPIVWAIVINGQENVYSVCTTPKVITANTAEMGIMGML
jgi:hypothetical protein